MRKTSSKPICIHFVCTGNAYRSRLAEAYLKSLKLSGFKVSSSGLKALTSLRENGPICWYAMRIATNNKITEFISRMSLQTNVTHLIKADYVIFMHPDNHQLFLQKYQITLKNYEVWDIPDLHHLGYHKNPNTENLEREMIHATEDTFKKIQSRVNDLIDRLKRIRTF
jgi:protein-tyrosine-phosphatase